MATAFKLFLTVAINVFRALATKVGPFLAKVLGTVLRVLGKDLAAFLAPVEGTIKDHLNKTELGRVVIAAITAGASLLGILQAIVTEATKIFPSPQDAALAVAVLTAIIEVFRRLGHGTRATSSPAPSPKG